MKKIKFLCVGDVVKLNLDDFNYLMKKAYPPRAVQKPEKVKRVRKTRTPKIPVQKPPKNIASVTYGNPVANEIM